MPARTQEQGSTGRRVSALLLASSGFGRVVGREVVVTVGRSALLLVWRGYAEPAL